MENVCYENKICKDIKILVPNYQYFNSFFHEVFGVHIIIWLPSKYQPCNTVTSEFVTLCGKVIL